MTGCQWISSPRRSPRWVHQVVDGFETYHVMNPYDDGIGLDELRRLAGRRRATGSHASPDYAEWLQRFETRMRALPDKQRQASLLPLLHNYQKPDKPLSGVARADGPVPRRGAGSEDRAGQGHPACHGRR